MSHWAQVGVQCECIKRGRWRRHETALSLMQWLAIQAVGLPIFRGTYTITAAGRSRTHGAVYIRIRGWGNLWFLADLFRPLQNANEAADIALFAPLLDLNHPRIPETAPREPANAGCANHGDYNGFD